MNLYDYNTVTNLLKKHSFTFSKALGQNFLIDESVCPRMAEYVSNKDCGVIEIGPGIGVLTKELCLAAKKVVAIELDKRLLPVLDETLSEFDNVEIISGDAMKLNLHQLIKDKFSDCKSVKVCANLPYYITSPVIMNLLQNELPIEEIIVMVQKEAAERFCAEIGSRDAGAVTVAVNYYAKSEMLFEVDRTSFMPSPKVDSEVIKLEIRKEPAVKVTDSKRFFAVVKAAFAQRRKTVVNSISSTLGVPKEKIINALEQIGISTTVRAEKITMEQFAELSEIL